MIMVKLANMAYKVANTEKLKQKRDYDLGRSLAAAILVNPGAGLGVGSKRRVYNSTIHDEG